MATATTEESFASAYGVASALLMMERPITLAALDRAVSAVGGMPQFAGLDLVRLRRELEANNNIRVGGYSVIVKDALPFAISQGNHAKCYGLNRLGMKRRGYSKETLEKLHHAYHLLLSSKLNTSQAVERMKAEIADCADVEYLIEFIESSTRGVVK